MKEPLKIYIAWFMLALFAYNMGGYLLVFKLEETFNRNSMQEFLSITDSSQLQILKIADVSSIIRKGDHEIIFEGNRYDIKKEYLKNGVTYFYCINDKIEETLYRVLHNSVSDNSDTQNQKHKGQLFDVLKTLAKDYFIHDVFTKIPDTTLPKNIFILKELFYSNNYFSVITPPPERVFS